ncbi:MAG: hypothetical protein AABZ32_02755 [Bacteroidota bacterium]
MNLKNYKLSKAEELRLKRGILAALSIPFIDSLEDFIWEGIFCYTKNLKIVDPLFGLRKKYLFDIVDEKNKIGWSAKAVQWTIKEGSEFELVIQRADVFKKRNALGFPKLKRSSNPDEIGAALLKHWQDKVNEDACKQKVKDKRVCILIKSSGNKKFAYFEEDLAIYNPKDLKWKWTDKTKTGLQGIRKKDSFCVYRWYPNQKQFFERFKFPKGSFIFSLEPRRIPLNVLIEVLNNKLQGK